MTMRYLTQLAERVLGLKITVWSWTR